MELVAAGPSLHGSQVNHLSSLSPPTVVFPRERCLKSRRSNSCSPQCNARNSPPAKGRGRYARNAAAEGLQRLMKGKEAEMEGWTQVALLDEFQEGKNKAIIHNNKGYVLVKTGEELHAIEANCTSCKFPVIEGKVNQEENEELGINCPLCHTKFSLVDGRVMAYCPKDGPLQWVIGTLKQKGTPEAAKVFPARSSKSGRVYVRFASMQVI